MHYNVPAFPTCEQTLMYFATHIASTSSNSNVKLHLAAIKHFSIKQGFTTQFQNFNQLYLLTRGIKRALATSRNRPKRRPITPSLLRTIHTNLFNSSRRYEDKVMLWAAITTAFFGFLRVSEYTASHKTKFDSTCTLLFQDVHIQDSTAHIFIKASKTDPFRQGVHVRLAANGTWLCPVSALRNFIVIHPTTSGPLFTFKNKKYLTRADMNKLLTSTTQGLANTSSHSLRIGAASTAAAMGCPKWLIQSLGRWTSDCFRRYIRVSDQTIHTTSRALAKCSVPIPTDFDPRA